MTEHRQYRYFDLIMAAFVTVLLCTNLIGVHKVSSVDLPFIGEFPFGASVLFFPLSYLFGDVLTEVYGFARSRKVIWAGFAALLFASLVSFVVTRLPAASNAPPDREAAVVLIFSQTWRVASASLIAFWAGEFVNSFVLAKMKIMTSGKFLWTRTIGSTIVGEAVDSLIFYPLAFLGTWPSSLVISVMVGNYFVKVLWEVFATPITYKVVAFLKRVEHEDYYDRKTNFNPFTLNTENAAD